MNLNEDKWDHIHGDASRVFIEGENLPHFNPILNIVMRFYKKQTKKIVYPILVSQQVLLKKPKARGQYLHMDSLKQYVVAIVPLNRCRSTLVLDIPYVNVGLGLKVHKYPTNWCSFERLGDMMDPGDVMVMWSNAIHAGTR